MLWRFFAIAALIFCFFSCSDSVCSIAEVSATAIFDFEGEDDAPDMRLSVFVQTEDGEVNRTAEIIVSENDSGYKWYINQPILLTFSSDEWAGYTNLKGKDGENLKNGTYNLRYTTAAGDSVDTQFAVSYPEVILQCAASDFPAALEGEAYSEKIAVYNGNGDMVFFGKRDDKLKTARDVKSRFSGASTFRVCYEDKNRRYACFMPAVSVADAPESAAGTSVKDDNLHTEKENSDDNDVVSSMEEENLDDNAL